MSLSAVLEKVKESCIFRAMIDKKVIGLRVKLYNVQTAQFDYYDFTVNTVENNQEVMKFLKESKGSFLPLTLRRVNGGLASEEEINGSITVKLLENEASVVAVLKPLMLRRGIADV